MDRDLLKENRIHGDEMFPFSTYTIDCKGSNNVLDCHWHDELEFLMVTEGRAVFQVGTTHYEVSAGQILFINSGELHAGYRVDDFPCSFCAIVFNPNLLCSNTFDALQSKFIEPLLRKQYILPVHIKAVCDWEKEIHSQFSEIVRAGVEKPYTYEILIKARLFLILSLLISNSGLSVPEKNYTTDYYKVERLKKALKYIQTNYGKKISVKELARQANMSEGHFCRFFKHMVRKTPVDYINYYRISKAAKLLENKSKKIIEVAMDVGFDNSSYFISIFKHYMRCTPSEYRRQN